MQTVQILNEGKLANGQHFQSQGQSLQDQSNSVLNQQLINGQIQLNGNMHQHHQITFGVNNGRVGVISPTMMSNESTGQMGQSHQQQTVSQVQ